MSEAGKLSSIDTLRSQEKYSKCSRDRAAIFGAAYSAPVRDDPSGLGPFICPEHLSFRFGVRRHGRRYERPPSVSYRANVGQDLLSLVFGHFALRVGQLVEAFLDFRPKLRAADFAVLLQGRLPGRARGFDFRRNEICRDHDCNRDQNDDDAHLQRELREALRRGGDGWIGNGDRGQIFDFARGGQILQKRRFFSLQRIERAVNIACGRVKAELRDGRDYLVVLSANGDFKFIEWAHGRSPRVPGAASQSGARTVCLAVPAAAALVDGRA